MTRGDEVFRQLQNLARSEGRSEGKAPPTSDYVIRHGLESFLARLAQTEHAHDFILKGGVLVGVYGVRRPTKDVDAEAVSASVTADHIAQVVADVAAVETDDGLTFDLATLTVQEIREAAEYPGLRMRVKARLANQSVTVAWDISTGDPIVPAPQMVTVPRIVGEPIEMLAYAAETIVAEKGVTILERGTTSTRWRDYIDIVQLAEQHGVDQDELLRSARAVARYRKVALTPIGPVVEGYGDVGQAKWAAWRRKEHVEAISEESLDAQMAKVAGVLDSAFAKGPGPSAPPTGGSSASVGNGQARRRNLGLPGNGGKYATPERGEADVHLTEEDADL